jgi:hypothetical protein
VTVKCKVCGASLPSSAWSYQGGAVVCDLFFLGAETALLG